MRIHTAAGAEKGSSLRESVLRPYAGSGLGFNGRGPIIKVEVLVNFICIILYRICMREYTSSYQDW